MRPTTLPDFGRQLARLEGRRRAGELPPGGRAAFDWFDRTCPCGLPAGECQTHPRAREAQRPPEADWRCWVYLGGRGSGKTRAACEFIRHQVETGRARRVALVAPTAADVRDTVVEGESGLLAVCPPWNRPRYEPSRRRLTWPSGAIATCYSADEPERLRGPQHDLAYVDEIGSWRRPPAWDNLRFGLRLGRNPRIVVTTTPRRGSLLKTILAEPTTVKTTSTTYDNRRHLAADFVDAIVARYEGTRLGRQEIHAELLEIIEGAWFSGFDPARHVTEKAGWRPYHPVRLAIDCGTSRCTGAVFFQSEEIDRHRTRITVFGDYYCEGGFSAENATAIQAVAQALCNGQVEAVRLDPASSARTGVGPAARGEYERVFGPRRVAAWPMHGVLDGLDTLELLLGSEAREADLWIHPRCTNLVNAFNTYARASRGGEWLNYPADPQHPAEDLIDAIRGGIRDLFPQGRKPQPEFRRVKPSSLWR